jgi:hypothetical protein
LGATADPDAKSEQPQKPADVNIEQRTSSGDATACEIINRDFPSDCDQMRAGFFLCTQVIQLMESVYLDLNLEEEYAHPDNYGWMNFFRHWSWSAMFRATWAVAACTYGARFQRFCEKQLDLKLGTITIDPPKPLPKVVERKEDLTALGVSIYEADCIYEGLGKAEFSSAANYSIGLLQLRVDLTGNNAPLVFPFGYALIDDKKGLRLYRVRDHLRNMGLGREGLVELVKQGRVAELNAKIAPASGPDEDGKARFQRLFDSAKIEAEHRLRKRRR